MNIIQSLNIKIDKLLKQKNDLILENQTLKYELDSIKNKNDELVRYNQDMLLKIDSTLTLVKSKENA